MKLGLVILNYNDAERSVSLAEQVRIYVGIDAVCIVDNASTDDSWNVLQSSFAKEDIAERKRSQIFLLQSGKNGGYAAGNNIGCRFLMENAGCDVLMIANPDVDFPEETVAAVRKGFTDYPEYGALGPLMKNPDGTVSDRPYLQIPTFWQGVGLCFYTYNRRYEKKHPYILKVSVPEGNRTVEDGSTGGGSTNKERIMTVDAVQGSLWAVRSDVFRAAGGLDEGTFLYYEEMAFAMRMHGSCPEYKEGLLLDASYVHNHSATIRSNLSEMRTFRIYMQSKLYFEKTYHHAAGLRSGILKAATLISRLEERLFLLVRRSR